VPLISVPTRNSLSVDNYFVVGKSAGKSELSYSNQSLVSALKRNQCNSFNSKKKKKKKPKWRKQKSQPPKKSMEYFWG